MVAVINSSLNLELYNFTSASVLIKMQDIMKLTLFEYNKKNGNFFPVLATDLSEQFEVRIS